jgi:NDP-sugar pyrophosphorylase family protein
MAGSSDEFIKAGYIYPKPLIDVQGKPLIQYTLDNLIEIDAPKKFIFIVRDEDCRKYHIDNTLKLLTDDCAIVKLSSNTKGALCTVLMAIDDVNESKELLILNSDQVLDIDYNEVIKKFRGENADSGLVTFNSVHPRWSYAKLEGAEVVQTAEKNPISRNAIAGFYYFSNSNAFFQAAFKTILFQDSIDGIFYLSPVINQYVLGNKVNRHFPIDSSLYHSFYSPQKVKEFENYLRK